MEVLVGEERTKFVVHKNVLADRSPFFKAAFERWKADGEPITLKNDDPSTFDMYLRCAYSNTLTIEEREPGEGSLWTPWVATYILADVLGDLRTTNNIVDGIIKYGVKYELPFCPDSVHLAFRSLPDSSPLRCLIVDYWILEASPEHLSHHLKLMPKELLCELVTAYSSLVISGRKRIVRDVFERGVADGMPVCHYHQHDESHPRSRCADRF